VKLGIQFHSFIISFTAHKTPLACQKSGSDTW